MTMPERDPIPSDLGDLYATAQTPEPPPGLESQLLAKLQAATLAPAAMAPAAAAPAVGGAVLGKFGALLAAGTFIAGLGGGALVTTRLATPPPAPPPIVQTVYVERPVPMPAPPPVAPPPPAPVEKTSPMAVARPSGQLAEEQRLIETARSALLRRDGALARVPLEAHLRRFPNGEHAEERDALLVQSFIVEGDLESARAKFDALEAKRPQSFVVPPLRVLLEQAEAP